MQIKLDDSWKKLLAEEFAKPYFLQLVEFIKTEYQTTKIYPPGSQIFSAFDNCPIDKVKVVILGQDPYHGANQANGLCFSVADDIAIPPSLKNIYKEIKSDLGKDISNTGNLEIWAKQGVLLLNATLTVRAGQAGSHQNKGWEQFTDSAIAKLSQTKKHLVFMLWGAYAKKKADVIDKSNHLILEAAHPSPFSAHNGFFGCQHFSKANAYLKEHGEKEVDW